MNFTTNMYVKTYVATVTTAQGGPYTSINVDNKTITRYRVNIVDNANFIVYSSPYSSDVPNFLSNITTSTPSSINSIPNIIIYSGYKVQIQVESLSDYAVIGLLNSTCTLSLSTSQSCPTQSPIQEQNFTPSNYNFNNFPIHNTSVYSIGTITTTGEIQNINFSANYLISNTNFNNQYYFTITDQNNNIIYTSSNYNLNGYNSTTQQLITIQYLMVYTGYSLNICVLNQWGSWGNMTMSNINCSIKVRPITVPMSITILDVPSVSNNKNFNFNNLFTTYSEKSGLNNNNLTFDLPVVNTLISTSNTILTQTTIDSQCNYSFLNNNCSVPDGYDPDSCLIKNNICYTKSNQCSTGPNQCIWDNNKGTCVSNSSSRSSLNCVFDKNSKTCSCNNNSIQPSGIYEQSINFNDQYKFKILDPQSIFNPELNYYLSSNTNLYYGLASNNGTDNRLVRSADTPINFKIIKAPAPFDCYYMFQTILPAHQSIDRGMMINVPDRPAYIGILDYGTYGKILGVTPISDLDPASHFSYQLSYYYFIIEQKIDGTFVFASPNGGGGGGFALSDNIYFTQAIFSKYIYQGINRQNAILDSNVGLSTFNISTIQY